MPVSPVDSLDPTPPRFLEHLHRLELSCSSAAEAATSLLEIWQKQAAQATLAWSQIYGEEEKHFLAALGSPVQPNYHEGEQLLATAEAQEAAFDRLCAPYDTMLREMAVQGRQALKNGVSYSGREREEEFKDALRLFQGVLNNPIGSRNFAVWFEVGWLQWMLGEAKTTTADSFYHAARLAINQEFAYLLPALRYEAYLQAEWGDAPAAWTTIQRAVATAGDREPMVWIEAARYALQTGASTEAQQLLDRALQSSPIYALALYSEPDLAPLYKSSAETIRCFTQEALEKTQQELKRLQAARTVPGYLGEKLEIVLDLPPSLPLPENLSQLGLFEAHSLSQLARREADQLFDAASTLLDTDLNRAKEAVRRFRVQIDQALSEKAYYEGSLHNIEEHARESGFTLHNYSFSNPFLRRRNQKAEDARFAYESFKQKLAQSDEFIASHVPPMERALALQERRCEVIHEVQDWLSLKRAA
jgi:hypothetical protein